MFCISQWLALLSLVLQTPGSEVQLSHPTVPGRGLKNNCPAQRAVCERALLILWYSCCLSFILIHTRIIPTGKGKTSSFNSTSLIEVGVCISLIRDQGHLPTAEFISDRCKKPTDTLSCLCSTLCIMSNLLYLCSAPDLIMSNDRHPAVATSLQLLPWPLRPLIPSTANSRMDHHHLTLSVHIMKVNGAQNNTGPRWLSLYGHKSYKYILQNMFFLCVSQEKECYTGLEWHEDE